MRLRLVPSENSRSGKILKIHSMRKIENSRSARRASTRKGSSSQGGERCPGKQTRRRIYRTIRAVLGVRPVRVWLYSAFLGTFFAFIGIGNILVCLAPFVFLVGLVFAWWLVVELCKIAPRLFALWTPVQPADDTDADGWKNPSCTACLFSALNEGGECLGKKKYGAVAPCEYFTPFNGGKK